MQEQLRRIAAFLEKITNFSVAVIFSIMIFACVMQVFTRYVLNSSVFWTEELARFCYLWSTFLAASICTKKGSHAAVSVFLNLLPAGARRKMDAVLKIIVCFAAGIMIFYGLKMVSLTFGQPSPALSISMGIFYGCVPAGGLLILLQSLISLFVEPEAAAENEVPL